MKALSLFSRPIHLGVGATASAQPEFTGMAWYEDYVKRTAGDGTEGRLVSLYRFSDNWDSWERHPAGEEVVCCLSGTITLHQRFPDQREQTVRLGPGDYAINPSGVWHTADVQAECTVLFITPGVGTEHRAR